VAKKNNVSKKIKSSKGECKMENNEEIIKGYSIERTQRLAGAEIWNVRASEDLETIGQAFVMYPEFEICHIMLAIEPDYMEVGDDILELLLDTLGVDDFVCSLTEWKEDIYSEVDEDEYAEAEIVD
jgi:uncharacterized protein YciU (UPF0263 family)